MKSYEFERICDSCGRGLRTKKRFCYKCRKWEKENRIPKCKVCRKKFEDKEGEYALFSGEHLLYFCSRKCLKTYKGRKRRRKLSSSRCSDWQKF